MNFSFDAMSYPYASRRSVVYGRRGMVATANPLAAQAGLEILKQGGNAIDAMIATAAALTVGGAHRQRLGSDAFALVWVKDKLYGLNASGPAPAAMTLEALQSRGFKEMPVLGMLPVTVPGTPPAGPPFPSASAACLFPRWWSPLPGTPRRAMCSSPLLAAAGPETLPSSVRPLRPTRASRAGSIPSCPAANAWAPATCWF